MNAATITPSARGTPPSALQSKKRAPPPNPNATSNSKPRKKQKSFDACLAPVRALIESQPLAIQPTICNLAITKNFGQNELESLP
jgi:hypothetical protein